MKKIKKILNWLKENYKTIKRYIQSFTKSKSNSLLQRKELINILVENNVKFIHDESGDISIWGNTSENQIYYFNPDGSAKYNSGLFSNKDNFDQVIYKLETYIENGLFKYTRN